MKVNPILLNLLSRRFAGFCLSLFVCYLKPEIKDTVLMLYAAMVAQSAASDYIQTKHTKAKE